MIIGETNIRRSLVGAVGSVGVVGMLATQQLLTPIS
jgi:hypothetical protein